MSDAIDKWHHLAFAFVANFSAPEAMHSLA